MINNETGRGIMKHYFTLLILLAAVSLNATEHPVAEWDFSGGNINSRCGRYTAELRGATRIMGDSGSQYLSVGRGPLEMPQGIALSKNAPELSPAAFRLEATFRLRKEAGSNQKLILWDSKYIDYPMKPDKAEYHCGFVLYLDRNSKGWYTPKAQIGLGGLKSVDFSGSKISLKAGARHTLSFSYDGTGTAEFIIDGKRNARIRREGGAMAKSAYGIAIGSRWRSNYFSFDGDIFSVKLYELERPDFTVEFQRRSFLQNEKDAFLAFQLYDHRISPARDAAAIEVSGDFQKTLAVQGEGGKRLKLIRFPLETRLVKGEYKGKIKVTGNGKTNTFPFTFNICTRSEERMPFLFWLMNSPDVEQLYGAVRDAGFNCGTYGFYGDIRKEEVSRKLLNLMDRMLIDGFLYGHYTLPPYSVEQKYLRVNREGKTEGRNMEASNPQAVAECLDVLRADAEFYSSHPAFGYLTTSSEVRDNSYPSFGGSEQAAFRKFAGYDIPETVSGRTAPHYTELKEFPATRLVEPDDPLLVYYRWFWKTGDGWNNYQTAVDKLYRKLIPMPFISFYDPSVRVPPLRGSGGNVTMQNQWTYVYPEPFNISAVISEQQAMGRGNPDQKIMSMIQGISYRSVLAPAGKQVKNPPRWLREQSDARYLTTPHDMVREALWAMASRKLDGMAVYGWRSLFDSSGFEHRNPDRAYQYSDPETIRVIRSFSKNVLTPLGPLLRRIPERRMEVALLESFPATIFAGRGSWGWRGWIYDCNVMLHYANLQPGVLYEEDIMDGGLDTVKVLVMPHCDVLSRPVYEKICEFQRRGGIVAADEFAVPGILPDIRITPVKRSGIAHEDKISMQKSAAELTGKLAPFYRSHAGADHADLLTWVRSATDADYLFVINDRRGYGDYVGQWRHVMEQGLPNAGKVHVARNAAAVYDLLSGREVPFEKRDGRIIVPVNFSTNDGRIFLVADRRIASLAVECPRSIKRGSGFPFRVSLRDSDGKTLRMPVPLKIKLATATGRNLFEDYATTDEKGELEKKINIPLNLDAGTATFSITELASGGKTSAIVSLE